MKTSKSKKPVMACTLTWSLTMLFCMSCFVGGILTGFVQYIPPVKEVTVASNDNMPANLPPIPKELAEYNAIYNKER